MFDIPEGTNLAAVAKEAETLKWFHNFQIFPSIRATGRDLSEQKLDALFLPDLKGKSVIDIGACDGFFSFKAEQLGASKVLAVDDYTWTPPHSDALKCFRFLQKILKSAVKEEYVGMSFISANLLGVFDVVLALGVLYHLDDPVDWLKGVRSVTAPKGMAIVETLVDCLDLPRPACAYYRGSDLGGDQSNRFGPNEHAVKAMLADAGFSRVVSFPPWHNNTVQITGYTWEQPEGSSGRMVFHAFP